MGPRPDIHSITVPDSRTVQGPWVPVIFNVQSQFFAARIMDGTSGLTYDMLRFHSVVTGTKRHRPGTPAHTKRWRQPGGGAILTVSVWRFCFGTLEPLAVEAEQTVHYRGWTVDLLCSTWTHGTMGTSRRRLKILRLVNAHVGPTQVGFNSNYWLKFQSFYHKN